MTSASPAVESAVEAVLGRPPTEVSRLAGGANNQVSRVVVNGRPFVAKLYFTHPGDRRDRLGTEFATLSFLWSEGLRVIPEPIAMDRSHRVGIYEFVDGTRLRPGDVALPEARALGEFLAGMRDLAGRPGGSDLNPASEAAFTLGERIEGLRGRLARLRGGLATTAGGAGRDAAAMVDERLAPAIERVTGFAAHRAAALGLELDAPAAHGDRTLSPGDIGFHNALRRLDGRLVFIDFEYAGWDETAQVLAQACLAPKAPLGVEHQPAVLASLLSSMGGDTATIAARLRILYPLLALKWSLIVLNHFVAVDRDRRAFAGATADGRDASRLARSRRLVGVAQESIGRCFLDDLVEHRSA